ncbi:exodeoxyribonuclease V subunit alpha [Arenimonas terrae]|uniref:RecBCD enzyme subunit RecD n=1 Tax=Arenimonas terrae TaxID=2546226 RepID=A0A5C4RP60_9GAMM|nr:exodeoxyribonuclease V subunit alpha [Arenimonas terrae]TNJ32912.1 exodeoxyribonuclease V subunit alpha [Arenimonas terrae]
MSHLRYEPRPPLAETEGPLRERMLARALARWVLSHGGSARLAEMAGRAAVAELAGDTALAPLADDAREALRSEFLVGDGNQPTPFVLDAQGRFYLWRNHRDEGDVAAAVRARRTAVVPSGLDEATLAALFPGGDPARDGEQRQAVRAVGGRRLFVLTGGPGTGKTTTVLRMLLRLQRDGLAGQGVAVAAPTGKAAQRLVQSLRQEAERLRAHLPPDWQPELDSLPTADALTVHRLLAYSPTRNAYTRGPDSPIEAGVVVVDEASMLDLAQLRALLRALRPEAALVLVGDADQLNPVGAGSVLMDLVAVLEAQGAPELVRLRHSFRADTRLVPVNEAVRAGDGAALATALAAAGERAALHAVEAPAALAREVRRWTDTLAEAGPPAPLAASGSATPALRALAARQLLCALRDGPFGADAMNAAIERQLRQRWNVPADQTWFAGRMVMVTRNDYGARLFNGDVGLCLAGDDGTLQVWFESAEGGARGFAPGALPAHEPAWAITVHKSQGSEYGHVAVLLPPDPEHRILSRQLLYTALSRAKHAVEIWAPRASLEAALSRPLQRAGGLVEKLRA